MIKKAAAKGTKLSPGVKARLVKATTNGKMKQVRTTCSVRGQKLKGKDKRANCLITTKKQAKKAVVKATPLCSVGLKITTRIVAKAAGAERETWKRTWKVSNDPHTTCTLPGNG